MENFQYSVQLSDQDWAEFSATAEECGLLQAALASGDELLSSDTDQRDNSPPGPPPLLEGQLAPGGSCQPGFEEEGKAATWQLVSRSWREPVLALEAGQQTPSTSARSDARLSLSSGAALSVRSSSLPGPASSGDEMQRLLQGSAPQGPAPSPTGEPPQSPESPSRSAAPQRPPGSPGAPPRSPSRKKRRAAGTKAGGRSGAPGSLTQLGSEVLTEARPEEGLSLAGSRGRALPAGVAKQMAGARQNELGPESAGAPERVTRQGPGVALSISVPTTEQGTDLLRMMPMAEPVSMLDLEAPRDVSMAKSGMPRSTPTSKPSAEVAQSTPASKPPAEVPQATPASKPPPKVPQSTPASKPPAEVPQSTPASKPPPEVPQSTPASKPPAEVPQSTPASKPPPEVPQSTPASKPPPEVPQSTPASKPPAEVPQSTPASKPPPEVPQSTPASKPPAEVPQSTPASKPPPEVPQSTPASKPPAEVPQSTPASKPPPEVPQSTPASKPPAEVPQSTPASKPPPEVPQSTPASKPPPEVPQSTPASKPPAEVPQSTPASKPPAEVPQSTPASKPPPEVPQSTPASKPPAEVPQSTPASKPPAEVPQSTPASKPQLDVDLLMLGPVVKSEVNSSTAASKATPCRALPHFAPETRSEGGVSTSPVPQDWPDEVEAEVAPLAQLGLSPVPPPGVHGEKPRGEPSEGAPGYHTGEPLLGPTQASKKKKVRFSMAEPGPEKPGTGAATGPPPPTTTPRMAAGGRRGSGAWDAVAVGPRTPQPRILKHLPPPAPSASGGPAPKSCFAVTLPEAYEFFFCDTIEEEEEEEDEDAKEEAEARQALAEVRWPEVCEFFFQDCQGQRVGRQKGRSPAPPPQAKPEPVSPGDPMPISIPEAYEHFLGEDRSGGVLEQTALLQVQAMEPPSSVLWGVGTGTPPEPSPATAEQLNLAIRQAGEPRGPLTSFTFSQNDMCLVFVAFATWAVRTSDLHAPDAWKTVLLANIGTISAIRYFRRQVRRGRGSPSPSRSPSP
uniref:PGC-1 and ERR-induced regulator in muscle protein 1 n=1 Tax=Sus scrofa TaxID=9823 RepID=A0A8D1QML9_PIG